MESLDARYVLGCFRARCGQHYMDRTTEAKTFVLELEPERLQTAPEFNQNNWPQMTDPQWIASVYNFYGLKPYWQP